MAIPNGPWDYEYESSGGDLLGDVGWTDNNDQQFLGGFLRVTDTLNEDLTITAPNVFQIRGRLFGTGGGDTFTALLVTANSGSEGYVQTSLSSLGVTDLSAGLIAFVDVSVTHTYTFDFTGSDYQVWVDDVVVGSAPRVPLGGTDGVNLQFRADVGSESAEIEWIAIRSAPYAVGTRRGWWVGAAGWG